MIHEMDGFPPANFATGPTPTDAGLNLWIPDTMLRRVRELVLEDFPNDLIKLVYLASLRDCNTGQYFHPKTSHEGDSVSASHALQLCHEEIFARLLATPLEDYVAQLGGYISYTHADKAQVIETWKSLPAYRATIPLEASTVDAEFFFASVEAALVILEVRGFG